MTDPYRYPPVQPIETREMRVEALARRILPHLAAADVVQTELASLHPGSQESFQENGWPENADDEELVTWAFDLAEAFEKEAERRRNAPKGG